jgi:hypothetical protein
MTPGMIGDCTVRQLMRFGMQWTMCRGSGFTHAYYESLEGRRLPAEGRGFTRLDLLQRPGSIRSTHRFLVGQRTSECRNLTQLAQLG